MWAASLVVWWSLTPQGWEGTYVSTLSGVVQISLKRWSIVGAQHTHFVTLLVDRRRLQPDHERSKVNGL